MASELRTVVRGTSGKRKRKRELKKNEDEREASEGEDENARRRQRMKVKGQGRSVRVEDRIPSKDSLFEGSLDGEMEMSGALLDEEDDEDDGDGQLYSDD